MSYLMRINGFLMTERRFHWTAVCLLLVLCFVVYHSVFTHEFLWLWDDHWVAVNGYTSRGFDAENLQNVLTDFYHGQYAPVNEFYYILLFSINGYDPFVFHLGGFIIHVFNVWLVYFFIYRLLTYAGSFEVASVRRISLATAVLMAIHPFLVESVSWVSASKIIVYSFFYLVALNFYIRYVKTGRFIYYLLTFIFFIISFGGKEQAVTMPLCLLLLDYVMNRNLKRMNIWLEKLPFFVLAWIFGLITVWSQGNDSSTPVYPIYQRFIFASYCLLEYFLKCIVPVKLSYIYPFPNQIGEQVPWRFWIYPFAVIAALISFRQQLKQKWILFGVLFFVIHILVALNIIPTSRFAIIADRYVYMAAIGPLFLLAWFYERIVSWDHPARSKLLLVCLLYITSLGIYAHERCKVWHNSNTLKTELRALLKERNDYEQLKLKFK